MAPTNAQQISSSSYTWSSNDENVEPIYLYDGKDDLDEFIDFWNAADCSARQRVDSVSNPVSPSLSDTTYTSPESHVYMEDFGLSSESLIEDHKRMKVDVHSVKSELRLSSTPVVDMDCIQDEVSQRLLCFECGTAFGTLRALDKHAQATSHKSWKCPEFACEKCYTRRDTFLRHRATHKEYHTCSECFKDGKQKVFKRRDHLREHMRNCHSKSSEGARQNSHVMHKPAASIQYDLSHVDCSNSQGTPKTPQQQAMKDLVRSLGAVLGDRCPYLVGKLDRMTALDAPTMESIAENMAVSALAKSYLSDPGPLHCSWMQPDRNTA